MKRWYTRPGDHLADDQEVVVRGGELDRAVLRANALRMQSLYGVYGISVFAVREATVDELAQQPPLVRFRILTLVTTGVLRGPGLRSELFDDLDDCIARLCSCEHRVMVNPYHEP
jgi:hypothetical protein